ncbi:hypothetical protein MesoLjLc_51820 [Mesorhizobium sp. L-8-10]|uniref:dihydrofolate reductase n=1 Tax=Mesorhizobium sp. L-8-10 TaxID=2744523 RepID=UPI0019291CEC|nr:dihydrofolate reductase [Mesorhizobium sp. L-8-10]BCH33252.1 hypothetical protein MesoLjLc_51820 [Mesorhizobium sp. L-8-10]
MTVNLIAAVGRRGQIGRDGVLPWSRPDDLAWFQRQTMGGVIVFGHRTYHDLIKKPSRFLGRIVRNFERHHRPSSVIADLGRLYPGWPIWVAGGSATYRAFAPFVDGLKLISAIDYDNDPADDHRHVFFPFDAYGISWGDGIG